MLALPQSLRDIPNLNLYFPHQDPDLPQRVSVGWTRETEPGYSWRGLERPDGPMGIFQYTLAGRGILERGGQRYIVQAGEAFLVEIPDDHHYYLPAGWPPWEFIYVCFDGNDLLRHAHRLIGTHGSVYPIPLDHAALGVYSELFLAVHQRQVAEVEQLAEMLYRFMLGLRRAISSPHLSPSAPVMQALQWAAQHYAEAVTIEGMAEASGLSRAHFCRLFRREMAQSPWHYLTDIRLQRARSLLRGTRLALEAIALQCGFAGAGYFGKVFLKTYGLTPTAYRHGETPPLAPPPDDTSAARCVNPTTSFDPCAQFFTPSRAR
ncbi:MAG TPA: AraC family transcriptional regulator [Armatimonadota bacterium]